MDAVHGGRGVRCGRWTRGRMVRTVWTGRYTMDTGQDGQGAGWTRCRRWTRADAGWGRAAPEAPETRCKLDTLHARWTRCKLDTEHGPRWTRCKLDTVHDQHGASWTRCTVGTVGACGTGDNGGAGGASTVRGPDAPYFLRCAVRHLRCAGCAHADRAASGAGISEGLRRAPYPAPCTLPGTVHPLHRAPLAPYPAGPVRGCASPVAGRSYTCSRRNKGGPAHVLGKYSKSVRLQVATLTCARLRCKQRGTVLR